jgi:phage gp36-like protein
MYITPLQLINFFGAVEIAQLSTPRQYKNIPKSQLLIDTISGVDSTDSQEIEAQEIEAAKEALNVINECISYAQKEMDSYLFRRYTLPLSEEVILLNPLTGFCADIVRYRLSKSYPKEEVLQRYEIVKGWLRDVSTGKASLVEPIQQNATPFGRNIYVRQGKSNFNWDSY